MLIIRLVKMTENQNGLTKCVNSMSDLKYVCFFFNKKNQLVFQLVMWFFSFPIGNELRLFCSTLKKWFISLVQLNKKIWTIKLRYSE